MEWLNVPQDPPMMDLYATCIVRICPNKGYCASYVCALLFCGKNK